MTEPVALKYRAFISYSHADTSWASGYIAGLKPSASIRTWLAVRRLWARSPTRSVPSSVTATTSLPVTRFPNRRQVFAAPKPVGLREGSYNVEGRYPSGDAYAGTVTISEQPGPYSHLAII